MNENLNNQEDPLSKLNSNSNSTNIVSITDRNEIEKIAKSENINNPNEIKSITYTIHNNKSTEKPLKNPIHSNDLKVTKVISDVKDKGNGWYYKDRYWSSIYDGPAHIDKTFTHSSEASFNANVNVSSSIVSAGVGFTIGKSYSVSENYSFDVAKGKKTELRTYINYQKFAFNVYHYYSNSPGLWYKEGSGTGVRI